MPTLSDETRKYLIEHWLPEVRRLKKDRQNTFRLMIGLLMVPLIFSVVYLSYQIFLNNWATVDNYIGGSFVTLTSVIFIYVGKLQSCNDSLLEISLHVGTGDKAALDKAVENLSCVGNLGGILKDVKSVGS